MGKRLNGLRRKAAGLRAVDGRESALSLSQGRLSPQSDLSNRKLIQQFESDAIPAGSFHHADHVRLAFAYLCQYPPLQALEKFSAALKRFAAARGKSQLYHEKTITHAYFLPHPRTYGPPLGRRLGRILPPQSRPADLAKRDPHPLLRRSDATIRFSAHGVPLPRQISLNVRALNPSCFSTLFPQYNIPVISQPKFQEVPHGSFEGERTAQDF